MRRRPVRNALYAISGGTGAANCSILILHVMIEIVRLYMTAAMAYRYDQRGLIIILLICDGKSVQVSDTLICLDPSAILDLKLDQM